MTAVAGKRRRVLRSRPPAGNLGSACAGLWPSEWFVTQPGIDSQRMERKILRRFRQFDFVNVDGFGAMPCQNFLGFGFFLRRSDSHPDKQALPFRLLFQSERALSI